jgi:hypothetical protein
MPYVQRGGQGTIDLLYVLFPLLIQLYRNMYSIIFLLLKLSEKC